MYLLTIRTGLLARNSPDMSDQTKYKLNRVIQYSISAIKAGKNLISRWPKYLAEFDK